MGMPPRQWIVIARGLCWIIRFFIARYIRADLTISSREGSTIFLAGLIQYSSASASAAFEVDRLVGLDHLGAR